MRFTASQSKLTLGELSPMLMARVDSEIFYSGVARAKNVVIMPHGGLRRRPGLTKLHDSLTVNGKMISFEFSTDQDYLIHIVPDHIYIYRNGVLKKDLAGPWTTIDEIKVIDAVQSGDTMILTHGGTMAPQMLQRGASDTDWTIQNVPLTNIPKYDFGGGDEDAWSATRGWPSVCTFFQGRLWLAGSPSLPTSVWGSKINSYYDFDIGTGQADFGLFDTLDTDQFNRITNIFAGRNLQVFTTGAEFYNTAQVMTPTESAWKRSTGYGSKRMRPLMVDGATLLVDSIGRTIRSFVFEFAEDAYVAPSISLLSEHLITDVVSFDTVKGTNIDISDFVYVVNEDGTCAVLNTLRNEKTQGWTQWTTEGDFVDVCVVNKVVYFLVKRNDEYHIEYMNEGTTLDHNTVQVGSGITQIDTNESPAMAATEHKIILDNSMMDEQLGGIITFPRPADHAEVGLNVHLVVRTMPLNTKVQDGISLNMRKRVVKVLLNVRNTLGLYAFQTLSPDRQFTVVLDEMPEPYTGLKEIYLLGFDRVTQIELTQNDPLPFMLLALGYETEV